MMVGEEQAHNAEPPSSTAEDTLSANEENEDEDDRGGGESDVCSLPECDSDLLGEIFMFYFFLLICLYLHLFYFNCLLYFLDL